MAYLALKNLDYGTQIVEIKNLVSKEMGLKLRQTWLAEKILIRGYVEYIYLQIWTFKFS